MARVEIAGLVAGACIYLSLLQASAVEGVPVHTYQAGEQMAVPSKVEPRCPVVNMTAEEHPLFYEFCYNVDRNETRDTAYLPGGYENAAQDFAAFVTPLRNEERVPMSDHCLTYLRPFVCFYLFPFSWPPVTQEDCSSVNVIYFQPCPDFCEGTFEACANELEQMIAMGNASKDDFRHLECHNFEQHNGPCVRPPFAEQEPTVSVNSTGEGAPTVSPAPDTCKCANVRDSVTQRTFTAYTYSLGKR